MPSVSRKVLDIKDLERCTSISPCVASYGTQNEINKVRPKFIRTENFIAHDYNEVVKYKRSVEDLDVNFDNCACRDNGIVDCIALCENNLGKKYVVGIDFTSIPPTCEEIKNKHIGCLPQDLVNNSKIVFVVVGTRGTLFIKHYLDECSNIIGMSITAYTIRKDDMYEKICRAPHKAILYLEYDK